MTWRIIGVSDPGAYLVQVSETEGRVLDVTRGKLYPVKSLHWLSLSTWFPYMGSQDILKDLLSKAEEVLPEPVKFPPDPLD